VPRSDSSSALKSFARGAVAAPSDQREATRATSWLPIAQQGQQSSQRAASVSTTSRMWRVENSSTSSSKL
jgi:hypothetical protein